MTDNQLILLGGVAVSGVWAEKSARMGVVP
jgi:hypothetical protein